MKHQQIEGYANGTALGGQNMPQPRANQVDPIEVPKIDTINSRISSPPNLRRSRSTSENPPKHRKGKEKNCSYQAPSRFASSNLAQKMAFYSHCRTLLLDFD